MMINADYTLRNVLNSQNSFHLKVLNDKKTMMARNCRYFVLFCVETHQDADMIQAAEGCLTREVSPPPPHLYLVSETDSQSQSQGYPDQLFLHRLTVRNIRQISLLDLDWKQFIKDVPFSVKN